METKTANQWEQLQNLCLTQAIKTIETDGNQIPNSVCAEIAERLTNIAIAIDKHQIQAEGLDHIKKIREFCNSITDEMEE